MPNLKQFLKKKNYTKIPLVLTATNHFEVEVKINGITGRFILDTGASNTCVGLDKIEFFNLSTKDSKIKAAGAGATDMETQISTKNHIKIVADLRIDTYPTFILLNKDLKIIYRGVGDKLTEIEKLIK